MSDKPVSLYEVNLLAILLFWFLERVGVLARLTPRLPFGDLDLGFGVTRLVLFILVWFMLWYLDTNFRPKPRWLIGMRSHQGITKGFDWLILLAGFSTLILIYGYQIRNPYLSFIGVMAIFAALHSLITGREPQVHPEGHDLPIVVNDQIESIAPEPLAGLPDATATVETINSEELHPIPPGEATRPGAT